jgi:hypothetical protein
MAVGGRLPLVGLHTGAHPAPHLHDKKHKDDVNNTDDAEAEDPHGGELGRYSGGGHSGAAHVLYAELFVTAGSSTTTHTVSLSPWLHLTQIFVTCQIKDDGWPRACLAGVGPPLLIVVVQCLG